MTLFKCKMCGGTLEVNNNETVLECEYCGTKQTLPRLDDDRRANLYDRANHFRRNNEFDKAMGIYEQILNEDNTDAEAYWSLVLCRYGIEYVEDPTSKRRIPTVNRAQFTSIFDDDNYKSALQYADLDQKIVYEYEAKTINEIQKGILAISQKEEPFDVFICYKETDNNGRRTQDSVLANDLYHQLTQEGFKVFFSRITLEDKLGTAYEPYIFAALNSAKVMVVLGTRPEYFNAVWVKNEWSRFLSLIKSGEKKTLIPAYRDMDPYDLPEEFSHLQAQDMSKLGFMQDLIRGIKKIAKSDEPVKTVVRETVVSTAPTNNNIAPLLKRAFMFLEDKNWASADEYFEKVLDLDPECAEAYLGKFMAELKVSQRESLDSVEQNIKLRRPLENNLNYQKAMRFGDEDLKKELQEYADRTNHKILCHMYDLAVTAMKGGVRDNSESGLKMAATRFEELEDFKDSKALAKECREKAEEIRLSELYETAILRMNSAMNEPGFTHAAALFKQIRTYKDSEAKMQECLDKVKELKDKAEASRKDSIYEEACGLMKKGSIQDYEYAIGKFMLIPGWKNADELIPVCRTKIGELKIKAEEEKAREEEARIRREQEEKLAAEARAKKKAKNKKTAKRIFVLMLIAACTVLYVVNFYIPGQKYKEAEALLEAKAYYAAIDAFEELGDFKDAPDRVEEIYEIFCDQAEDMLVSGNKRGAAMMFGKLDGYKDAKERSLSLWNDARELPVIAIGGSHTVGLKLNGKILSTGWNEYGQCDVSGWKNIISVEAGSSHTVGLRSDGTVVAIGNDSYKQCNVSVWENIVAIAAGGLHTVGLKADGTAFAVGNYSEGPCDVFDWTDIVDISAGEKHTVALRFDGTVTAVGRNDEGQCDVSEWRDIICIVAGWHHTVGLKSNGTVVATGFNGNSSCNVENWSNVISVSAGAAHTVGLRSDGTVVATGDNGYGQCNVSSWKDIVAVYAGSYQTVGLKADGTVVAVGKNEWGQCDVSGWKNIRVE